MSPITPLVGAMKYAGAGHPVLPLAPGTKAPLAELVPHGLKDATTNPETLRIWWTLHPDADVGIRCDRLLVLDIDPGGDVSLKALEVDNGQLPVTREQRTPRGGRHLLYRLPAGIEIGNGTRGIGAPVGIDVRAGDKGYIVVAPSQNENGAYRWSNSGPIANAPMWLVDALSRPATDQSSAPAMQVVCEHSPYGRAALEAEADAVEATVEGQRNSRLNEAAFALGQLESGGELAAGDAEEALVAAAIHVGLSETEARRTVRSGLDAGRSSPRSAPPGATAGDRSATATSQTEASDAMPNSRAVRFVPLGEYVSEPKGSSEALLGDEEIFEVLLPVGGLLLMYGDQGTSKTTTALDLVAHLASGTDWHGKRVTRPVRAALIENEGPAEQWRQKLARKLESWEGDPWQGNVLVLAEPHGGFDFRRAEHRQALHELRREGIELIVADPTKWLGFHGGGTPDEVSTFVSLLRECGLHSGDATVALAFLLLHHENKAGDVSGAWGADPDTLVHVELDGRERTKLTWSKCRWAVGQHGRVEVYRWVPETAGFEPVELHEGPQIPDEELDGMVRVWLVDHPGKHSTTAVRGEMPVRSERVDQALERLKAQGECLDLDRRSSPHDGRPRTHRYWVATVHADSQVVPLPGTTSDDITSGSPEAVRSRPVVPPIGGTTTGRDKSEQNVCGVALPSSASDSDPVAASAARTHEDPDEVLTALVELEVEGR